MSLDCVTDADREGPAPGACLFDSAGELDEDGHPGAVVEISDYGINDPIATIDGELFTVSYRDSADTPLLATWTIGPLSE